MTNIVHYLRKTTVSCHWQTCTTRCIMANVLQTNVDAQCDKPATELSWQHLQLSPFSCYLSKVANLSLPHLHLAPLLGWPHLSCA